MRILICSDGSKWAHKSARFALQLFRDTAHQLTILVFKQRAGDMGTTKKTITRDTQNKEDNIGSQRSASSIDNELQVLVDELSIDTHEIGWLREEGDMAKHILAIANDYELVCLGGAGKGGFSQNMLGMIADELIMEGTGNLMVTKTSDVVCRNILVAVTPDGLNDDLGHYLGTLFQGSPTSITIDVLREALPERFDGYLDATSARRVKEMSDADLFQEPDRLRGIADIIESYGIECSCSYRDYQSLSHLIDDVEPHNCDLVIIHHPTQEPSLFERVGIGRGQQRQRESLNLMRKTATNVMLLRSIPVVDG